MNEEPPYRTVRGKVGVASTVEIAMPITVSIGHVLWAQWLDIAVENEGGARRARAEVVAGHRHQQEYAPALGRELETGLVGISAAAHALDALYGQLVTDEVRATGPKDAHREAYIRECLKARFSTGRRDSAWVREFRWLFGLRDAAVHDEPKVLPSVPHPSGTCNSGQINRDYSAEAVMRAVDLVCDVFTTCLTNPKPSDTEAQTWAAAYASGFKRTEVRLLVSREVQPLVTADPAG